MNYNLTNITSVADPGAFVVASNQLSGGLVFNGILVVILVGAIILHYNQNKDLPMSILVGGAASTSIGLIMLIGEVLEPTIFFMCLATLLLGLISTGFSQK